MLFTCNLLIVIHVELPPAKRRRTLAGSIVSTALSAALIGTAVGLTVYRLCVLNLIRTLLQWLNHLLAGETGVNLTNFLPLPLPHINAATGFRTFQNQYVLPLPSLIHLISHSLNRSNPRGLSRRASPVRPHRRYGVLQGVITASLVQNYKPSLLPAVHHPHIPLPNRSSTMSTCINTQTTPNPISNPRPTRWTG